MVYANVIKEPFGALPSDEDDTQWIREHKMKAFRAVTTGEKYCVFSLLSLFRFLLSRMKELKIKKIPNFTLISNFSRTRSATGKNF